MSFSLLGSISCSRLHDFTCFCLFICFLNQESQNNVSREIKLILWNGPMPLKVDRLHFPLRNARQSVRGAWICSNQLAVLIVIVYLNQAAQLAAVCPTGWAPRVADSFFFPRLNGSLFQKENRANLVCPDSLEVLSKKGLFSDSSHFQERPLDFATKNNFLIRCCM